MPTSQAHTHGARPGGLSAVIAILAFQVGVPTWVGAQEPTIRPHATYDVVGEVGGKKPGKAAVDISGIACMDPPGSASPRCLLVNDESTFAQLVTIKGSKFVAGEQIPLIGADPDPQTLGSQPRANCPKSKPEFGEFDGEAVAYSKRFFYVVGSHGCARRTGKFKPSSFLLARVGVDEAGRVSTAVETTYRLSEALRKPAQIAAAFGKDLNGANGLNIEGMAVIGERVMVGLRAPNTGGTAYLVGAAIPELFAPGKGPAIGKVEVIELALGAGLGVRDLAPLPNGTLLVLAGPAQEQPLPYALFTLEPHQGGRLTKLATLESLADGGKAEAVTVLEARPALLRILVLFDGPEDGAPREYRVPLK